MDIDILWEGPFTLDNVISKKKDYLRDYGVYQIYGHHPLYGSDVLLYIGLAALQTFGDRIKQETWHDRPDAENTQVYIGRFVGRDNINDAKVWNALIERAEKLLIYAHKPAFNTQNTKSLPEEEVLTNRVYNWGKHRDLFPEVSGVRYTTPKLGYFTSDHIFQMPSEA